MPFDNTPKIPRYANETEIVEGMIKVLERGGWVQGEFSNASGAHCLVGALQVSALFETSQTRWWIKAKLAHLISPAAKIDKITNPGSVVMAWNDTAGRSEKEVLDLLRDLQNEILQMEDDHAV